MKIKATEACLEYNVLDDLKVIIDVHRNAYEFPTHSLFSMAARKNKKRSFLFVSKVLGKHIPVNPYTALLSGYLLSNEYLKKVYGKDLGFGDEIAQAIISQKNQKRLYHQIQSSKIKIEKTIFIGFAETATSLGHSVFDMFDNVTYMHTTRDHIKNKKSVIQFEEEHSHATTHKLYVDDCVLDNEAPIVFVDDEMTTGKTTLNIIREIQKRFPRKQYAILSLLDWRSKEDVQRFEDFEKELDVEINTVSLLSGNIDVNGGPVINPLEKSKNLENNAPKLKIYNLSEKYHVPKHFYVSEDEGDNDSPYLEWTGRFGINSCIHDELEHYCKNIGSLLSKKIMGEKTLVLGVEEFMYIPMKIASYMGEGVYYQSTTISPIFPCDKEGYGVRGAHSFKSFKNSQMTNYFYNINGQYDDLFIIIERDVNRTKLKPMIDVLRKLGIRNINIIILSGEQLNLKKPQHMGSYDEEDVTFLLKDISHVKIEKETVEREKNIQKGRHYSEMLPIEYKPSSAYMDLFHQSLNKYAQKVAQAVGIVSEKILRNRGKDVVLVSLARAGTPIGILIKRYLMREYNINCPHYSISIIRGKGIDENAVLYILKNHPDSEIQFIDGWTGKGAITQVLNQACDDIEEKYSIILNKDLAVLADPGHCVSTYGTREDFLIPSACLNSTISGLVSRTVLRDDLIGERDFHGAKYYKELSKEDLSNYYLHEIVKAYPHIVKEAKRIVASEDTDSQVTWAGMKDIIKIQQDFKINDVNLIKPGIGETTRVLLRRLPWKILIKSASNNNLEHIRVLAKEKNVEVMVYPNMTYECCGLIKPIGG